MKNLILFLTFSIFYTGPSAADDYPRNYDIDILHYSFSFILKEHTDTINGSTAVDLRFLTENIREFSLDFIGYSPELKTGMNVLSVMCDENPLLFEHRNNRLLIRLGSAPEQGSKIRIVINYSGIPADGLIISRNKFGDRTYFGDNWPDRARHWIPVIDHPYEKATCEFIVTAPEKFQVIASGALQEISNMPDGMKLTHWKGSVPISTKVMTMGVARFAVQFVDTFDGIPISTWVFPQNRDAGFYDFARSRRILKFFTNYIGPYPYEKLANVQSRTRYGGLENAGNIFYNERYVTGDRSHETTVVHEIAHQWFGDSVTEADWHHVWLSEGFATYFTHLFKEFTEGRDIFVDRLKNDRIRIIRYQRERPDSPVVDKNIKNLMGLLSTNTYQKGSWVLHMLRKEVGDDIFREGIRAFYRQYRDSTALTEDFQKVMEETCGYSLETFFNQWIFKPGQPFIAGSWHYDIESNNLSVELEQEQEGGILFTFPLEIGIDFDGGTVDTVMTIQFDGRKESLHAEFSSEPREVVLDPGTWLLMQNEFDKKN